jgi:phosphoserine aminotransferase
MNVVFRLADEAREEAFLAEAERRGMVGLRGHRSVGGCRASLYAGLAMDAVDALVELMDDVRRAG